MLRLPLRLAVDRRELIGTRDTGRRLGLENSRRRDADVEVLGERRFDQLPGAARR